MSIVNIATAATEELVAKYRRRVLAAVMLALFALTALYHLTAAGFLVLEAHVGALNARLIVAGIFVALTLASAGALWIMRPKAVPPTLPGEPGPRAMQIAMLVEAVTLGFEVSRKKQKAS